MQLDKYQQMATRTATYTDEIKGLLVNLEQSHPEECAVLSKLLRLNYVASGLAGEAGEFANKIKKLLRDHSGYLGENEARELSRELGDVLWYTSQAAREIGRTLDEIANENLEILADRQSRGVIQGSGDDR